MLIIATSVSANAEIADLAQTGDKIVITDDNWAYEKVNVYGWELDEYVGTDAVVELPWSFAKEYVTSIGDHAFNDNTTVTSVLTTEVLESIGDYAFSDCTSLQSVVLFSSLKSIGVGCFYGDSMITDVNICDTAIVEIPAYCFAECGINELFIPTSCLSIGNYAFYNCTSLSKIIIPDSVTSIANNAFTDCDNLVIYGSADSYAIEYAVESNIDYVITDNNPDVLSNILGDADNSGYVDIVDATFLQRYATHIYVPVSADILMQGDVDNSGSIEITDAGFIMRHLIHVATPYPIGETITI